MAGNSASHALKNNVFRQVQILVCTGLPARAQWFVNALAQYYDCSSPLAGFTRRYLD